MPEVNAGALAQAEQRKKAGRSVPERGKNPPDMESFSDADRYIPQEIIGRGSYGVVCSAIDRRTGEKVAIKKIGGVFDDLSDAARTLREIKLLRLLRHPDIVEIKHVMLPPARRDYKDIYVVFELMEADLHQVIKANPDLTTEHHQYFLYQMLRALKYMHAANVYHWDLKPKNILLNADCKLKICDFGLARVAFDDSPTTVFCTDPTSNLSPMSALKRLQDYIATRWYRAPELCGSFFSKYSPAIDMWSIGCIFAEILTGEPLFPGKNVFHQFTLMTNLLGTPSTDTISQIQNEKARKFLSCMRKQPIPFSEKFPGADPSALKLLQRLLAFDPKDRPTAEEALADPYFEGIGEVEREPSCQPIPKMEFEFEEKFTEEDVKELIFLEILQYHPQLLKDYKNSSEKTSFLYPSAVDKFHRQFTSLEENRGSNVMLVRKNASLPRTTTVHSTPIPAKEGPTATSQAAQRIPAARPGRVVGPVLPFESASVTDQHIARQVARNPAVPPATNTSSAYCYHLKPDSADRQEQQLELEEDHMQYRTGQHPMDAKVAHEMGRNKYARHSTMLQGACPKRPNRQGQPP
ncbi:Putative MAP kinase family protein [Zea mays]|uniref:mitogen-activated protein kinase n=1 Tax=Zea mays TaxID=4577 RepID=A0A1D6FKD5_MAIZE|nr:Putative MAP kinase family protein [Zea mays]